MKRAIFGIEEFELGPNSKWVGPDPDVVKQLNEVSQQTLGLLSPSHGSPRQFVFDEAVELFAGDVILDDEESDTPDGVIY